MSFKHQASVVIALGLVANLASAQSNLGELLDKGAKKMLKEDYAAMAPFRVQYLWPQGGGEGDLVYKADGTLAGTEYHWPSSSQSPAVGSWTVDDGGKWCIKKTMAAWKANTDVCWYSFRLGDDFFGGLSDDRTAKVFKVKSLQKQ